MSPTRSGESESTETEGTAVEPAEQPGPTQATPSSAYKTRGRIDASSGTGVLGHNTATAGVAHGVEGTTDSTDFEAAGVKGQATDTHGMWATSENSNGIRAITDAIGYGGVYATNTATSGSSPAIIGYGYSPDWGAIQVNNLGGGSGVMANGDPAVDATGDVAVDGDVNATGTVSVDGDVTVGGAVDATDGFRGSVGVEAWLNEDQQVSQYSSETIGWNAKEHDQRFEFDTSTGEFTCAFDGTYHVDVAIQLKEGTISAGNEVYLRVYVGTYMSASAKYCVSSADTNPTIQLSRTFFDLAQGDVLTAEIGNPSSSSLTIDKTVAGVTNYFTIHQVG